MKERVIAKIPICFAICEGLTIEYQINKFGFTLGNYADQIEDEREKIHNDYIENRIEDKKKNRLYLQLYNKVIGLMVRADKC